MNFDFVIGDLVDVLSGLSICDLLFISKILCVTYVHTCWYSFFCFCLCYVLTTDRISHSLMVKCHTIFQLSDHGKKGASKQYQNNFVAFITNSYH